jgi:hypothetical protein
VEASSINAPHPDDQAAEDLFFGGGEEDEATPAAEPDPGTFDPVSGTFPEGEVEAPAKKPEPAAEAEVPDAVAQQEKLRAIAQREADEAAAAAAEAVEDTPEAEAVEDAPEPEPKEAVELPADGQDHEVEITGDAPEPEAEAGSSQVAVGEEPKAKQSGPLEREYIVFQKIPLTERVLKHLLKQIEDGKAAEPRVAFFELHRCEARNVNGAVAAAYTKHQSVLGEKADMAAVSSRSFQEKHVEPKQKVETNLSIT